MGWSQYYLVGAHAAAQAAQLLLDRMLEVNPHWWDADPRRWRIEIDDYDWTGKPGFCLATDTDGDVRFDVELSEGQYTVYYSERSLG